MNDTELLPPHSPTTPTTTDPDHLARTLKVIRSRSFAMLSTVSPGGFPHAAGVSYAADGTNLYVNTERSSRKARNVAANDRVAVVIPMRRVPIGPPFTVQFQARATLLEMDDPEITALLARGALHNVTSHGELESPDGCFVRIAPNGPVHTFGIAVPILAVARDPLTVGARSLDLCSA